MPNFHVGNFHFVLVTSSFDAWFNAIARYIIIYLTAVPIQQQVVGGLETQSDSIEHLVPPFRLTESGNGTNGFMLVGDSGETESLSHHLKVERSLEVRSICYSNL